MSTASTWSTPCPPTSWPLWPGTSSPQTSGPGRPAFCLLPGVQAQETLSGPGMRPASVDALCGPARWGQPCPCLTVTAQGPSSPSCSHPGALCRSFWAVPLQAHPPYSETACGAKGLWGGRQAGLGVGRRPSRPESEGRPGGGRGLGLGGPRPGPAHAHRLPRCRSRVWAEPCLLPTATSKLSGAVEQWLSAAERLYGPYLWGRYVC